MTSRLILLAALVIGLVAGSGLTYFVIPKATSTLAVTTSSLLVAACLGGYDASGYCEANGYPSPALLGEALNYSSSSKLNVTCYTFQPEHSSVLPNNTLQACLVNVGSMPMLLSYNQILLNNTYFQSTILLPISSNLTFVTPNSTKYLYVAPFSPATISGGQAYVDPRMMFTIAITVPNASVGENWTLQIYSNTWTLKYGTASSPDTPYSC